MQAVLNQNTKHNDYYGAKLITMLTLLMLLLASTSYYLFQNYFSNSFLEYGLSGKKVYFLKSDTLESMYEKNGMDYKGYQKRLKHFKQLSLEATYDAQDISSDDIESLPKNAKLVALDMMSLSDKETKDIDKFVRNGGRLLFNFTSGFLDTSLKFRKNNLVKKITTLTLDEHINTIKQDPKHTGYVITKLLSPLSKYLPEGKGLEFIMYDPLPIYNTKLEAETYMTSWGLNNYFKGDKKKALTKEQSGLIWKGSKKSGKWIYFSFPSYVFVDGGAANYSKIFKGMLDYLDKDIIPIMYPYIDAKNVIFISEDTEYKFATFEQFYNVSLKNKFPVTAFCVANLAQKHSDLMDKVVTSKYMEIGSHSYTHKKIVGESDAVIKRETAGANKLLHTLTNKKIIGFRPPREELNEKIITYLQESGTKYIVAASESRLAPYMNDEILIIPRHGTDDYSYLINLDWNSSQILKQMEIEANILADLNGIYTLSTHTHLMSFSSNINITDKFMQYVNKQKRLSPMNGEMLYKRIMLRDKIHLSSQQTNKKLIMTFSNESAEEIHDIHYELSVAPDITLGSIESEVIGIKTQLIKNSSNTYTLIIKSMKPKSQMILFLNYDKNS